MVSGTTMPSISLEPSFRALAAAFGRYPRALMASRTFAAVTGETRLGPPFTT